MSDRTAAGGTAPARQALRFRVHLPDALAGPVDAVLRDWESGQKAKRVWDRDAGLWTGGDEGAWLGWLDLADASARRVDRFAALAAESAGGVDDVLLLGMGGSSLAPEVIASVFGARPGAPRLRVLDSTDPQQVRAAERAIDPARTIFVVSSKSGTTLETDVLRDHFLDVAGRRLGAAGAGRRFVAITDQGSPLEAFALGAGFRKVFTGAESVGGRFSALSDFGLVPAALAGIDVTGILATAAETAQACGPKLPIRSSPGVLFGAVLGVASREGVDKLTLLAGPKVGALGAWIEQLVVESTGKQGRGIVVVDGEPPRPAATYDDDRLFVHLSLEGDADPASEECARALERADRPVVRIALRSPNDLGGEFFRWEFATAVAASLLGIHPFDQPDVESTKAATRRWTAAFEESGTLPTEAPLASTEGISVFADPRRARSAGPPGPAGTVAAILAAHLARLAPQDVFALLAFVERNPVHEAALQRIRTIVRDRRRVATTLGFGPRFLHSTGQGHKGGPNHTVFLQVTADDVRDITLPSRRLTFSAVKTAQARADLEVLAGRGRRVLRVHLGADVAKGLATLERLVDAALP